jgi:hypothetical protein
MNNYPTNLTDSQWQFIEKILNENIIVQISRIMKSQSKQAKP